MQEPNYRISPSLLNSYQQVVDAELLWQDFYGSSDEPSVSLEEFQLKQEQELLDSINRVKKEPIEAASKGTALNEIVDCILEHRLPGDGIVVKTIRDPYGEAQHILANIDGFCFQFDAAMCLTLANYFRGSICQYPCEATIDTAYGPVILYGYPDYIRKDVVYDLKSTARYSYGKYATGWQKDLYPWCLIESNEVDRISGFEYTAMHLSGGTTKTPIISGTMYREWYDYDHQVAGDRLRGGCESLILWVEQHRDQITNTRIFNK